MNKILLSFLKFLRACLTYLIKKLKGVSTDAES